MGADRPHSGSARGCGGIGPAYSDFLLIVAPAGSTLGLSQGSDHIA